MATSLILDTSAQHSIDGVEGRSMGTASKLTEGVQQALAGVKAGDLVLYDDRPSFEYPMRQEPSIRGWGDESNGADGQENEEEEVTEFEGEGSVHDSTDVDDGTEEISNADVEVDVIRIEDLEGLHNAVEVSSPDDKGNAQDVSNAIDHGLVAPAAYEDLHHERDGRQGDVDDDEAAADDHRQDSAPQVANLDVDDHDQGADDDRSEPGAANAVSDVLIENADGGGSEQDAADVDASTKGATDQEEDSRFLWPPGNPWPQLYVVTNVIRDDNGTVIDVEWKYLDYYREPATVDQDGYHIYGATLVKTAPLTPTSPSEDSQDPEMPGKLSERASLDEQTKATVDLNPSSSIVRSLIYDYGCPGGCADGRLNHIDEARALVTTIRDDLTHLPPYLPHCPVCIGEDVMTEQLALREQLHNTSMVDIPAVMDLDLRVNSRRAALNYTCEQFDEREWNLTFDDTANDDWSGSLLDDGGWQIWPEALDPNAIVQSRPANKAAVTALPRRSYVVPRNTDEDEKHICNICQGDFKEGQEIVELPCGHIYCAHECIELWLKRANTCPYCRAEVAEVEETSTVTEEMDVTTFVDETLVSLAGAVDQSTW